GKSMVPTYHNGRINFINRLSFRWHGPKRGDVVAVQLDKSRLVLLKRVVGLPGERIAVRAGRMVVNGRTLMSRMRTFPEVHPRKVKSCSDPMNTLSSAIIATFRTTARFIGTR